MKVLLATDQSRHSRAAAKFLQKITFPVGSELFLWFVNTLRNKTKMQKPGEPDQVTKSISSFAGEVSQKNAKQRVSMLSREGVSAAAETSWKDVWMVKRARPSTSTVARPT